MLTASLLLDLFEYMNRSLSFLLRNHLAFALYERFSVCRLRFSFNYLAKKDNCFWAYSFTHFFYAISGILTIS